MKPLDPSERPVVACPWCGLPVVIRPAAGGGRRLFDPFLDGGGRVVGVRAAGHACAGSDLRARAEARAS